MAVVNVAESKTRDMRIMIADLFPEQKKQSFDLMIEVNIPIEKHFFLLLETHNSPLISNGNVT